METISRSIGTGNSNYKAVIVVNYQTNFANNETYYFVTFSLFKESYSEAAPLSGTYKLEVGGKTYSYDGSINWWSDQVSNVIFQSSTFTQKHDSLGDASVSIKLTLPFALRGASGTHSVPLRNTKIAQFIDLVTPDGLFDNEIAYSYKFLNTGFDGSYPSAYYTSADFYLGYGGVNHLISTIHLGNQSVSAHTEKYTFDSSMLEDIYNRIPDRDMRRRQAYELYTSFPTASFDLNVMERADNVYLVVGEFGWADIGTWDTLYATLPKDSDGNVLMSGKVLKYDSHNNIVALPKDKLVVMQGVDDMLVVDTESALVICRKGNEQDIRKFLNDAKMKFGNKIG